MNPRRLRIGLFFALFMLAAVSVTACILGPKPDDPAPSADLDGGIAADTSTGGADVASDVLAPPSDTSSPDTGTTKTDGSSDAPGGDGDAVGDAGDAGDAGDVHAGEVGDVAIPDGDAAGEGG